MPYAVLQFCAESGCPERTAKTRCPAHQRQHKGSAASMGYDKDWRRVRLEVLQVEPFCRLCATKARKYPALATEVDHIIPMCEGGARLELVNLQPICDDCHRTKTHDDKRRRAAIQ